jgi:hypothetical protein
LGTRWAILKQGLTAVGVGARVYGRFQKLPPASNGKFLRCLVVFFSLHMAKHGPDMLLDQLERVQARAALTIAHTPAPSITRGILKRVLLLERLWRVIQQRSSIPARLSTACPRSAFIQLVITPL